MERERQVTTAGEPQFRLVLSGAFVADADVLGDPAGGGAIVDWLHQRAAGRRCARCRPESPTGRCASPPSTPPTREQFGKPIATFQAVAQRAADAYIDVEAVRWTMWQAAWRLTEGRPAEDEIAVAKFWAADAGHRVTYAAQHLHGGIGLDVDYPVHRYFLWSKQIELSLGSATRQLLKLGAAMAEARRGERAPE